MDESRLADTLQKYEKKGRRDVTTKNFPSFEDDGWFLSHALPVFCLIRLFFCLSKTVWSSLGILVLSVGCFFFLWHEILWVLVTWVWYTIQTLHGTYGSRTYASQLNTQEDRRLKRTWKDAIILWVVVSNIFDYYLHRKFGESNFDEHIFRMGLKPPTRTSFWFGTLFLKEKKCNINKIPDAQCTIYLPTFFSKTTQVYIGK